MVSVNEGCYENTIKPGLIFFLVISRLRLNITHYLHPTPAAMVPLALIVAARCAGGVQQPCDIVDASTHPTLKWQLHDWCRVQTIADAVATARRAPFDAFVWSCLDNNFRADGGFEHCFVYDGGFDAAFVRAIDAIRAAFGANPDWFEEPDLSVFRSTETNREINAELAAAVDAFEERASYTCEVLLSDDPLSYEWLRWYIAARKVWKKLYCRK